LDAAALIPEEWMRDSRAFRSAEEGADNLSRFAAAGVDAITTYGSTPAQNAGLLDVWRRAQVTPG
jgi:5,10-methylenetetrahydromethanopterin reductase